MKKKQKFIITSIIVIFILSCSLYYLLHQNHQRDFPHGDIQFFHNYDSEKYSYQYYEKWHFGINNVQSIVSGAIYSEVTADENNVYIGGMDNYFYCLNKTQGSILWKIKTNGYVYLKPLINNNHLFFASEQSLYCVNLIDGSIKWQSNKMMGFYDMVIVNESLIGGEYYLTCFNTSSGLERWDIKSGMHIVSRSVASNDCVVVAWVNSTNDPEEGNGSYGIKLFCYDINDGTILWYKNFVYIPTICDRIINNNVFLHYLDEQSNSIFSCVDLKTGNEIWHFKENLITGYEGIYGEFISDNIISLITHNRLIHLSTKTGEIIDTFSIQKYDGFKKPQVYDQDKVCMVNNGTFQIYSATQGNIILSFNPGAYIEPEFTIYYNEIYIPTDNLIHALVIEKPIEQFELYISKSDFNYDVMPRDDDDPPWNPPFSTTYEVQIHNNLNSKSLNQYWFNLKIYKNNTIFKKYGHCNVSSNGLNEFWWEDIENIKTYKLKFEFVIYYNNNYYDSKILETDIVIENKGWGD